MEGVAGCSDRIADSGAGLASPTLAGAELVAALVAVGSRGRSEGRGRIGQALLVVLALGVFAVLAGGAVAVRECGLPTSPRA